MPRRTWKKSVFHHKNKVLRNCLENNETLDLELFEDGKIIKNIRVIEENLDSFILEFECPNESSNLPLKIVDDEENCSIPNNEINSIKRTKFDDIIYRSKLEAKHAFFMKFLDVKFHYEPLAFNFPSFRYIPDFWIPELDVFVEIKPRYPYVEEIEKCEFVSRLGFNIVLLYGTLTPPHSLQSDPIKDYSHENGCRGMGWKKNGERIPGEIVWIERDGKFMLGSSEIRNLNWDHEKILEAYDSASKYNF